MVLVVVKLVLLLMFLVYYNYYVLNLGGIIGRIKSIIGGVSGNLRIAGNWSIIYRALLLDIVVG